MSLVFVFVNVFHRCQLISYIASIFRRTTFTTRPPPGIMAAKVGRKRQRHPYLGLPGTVTCGEVRGW